MSSSMDGKRTVSKAVVAELKEKFPKTNPQVAPYDLADAAARQQLLTTSPK